MLRPSRSERPSWQAHQITRSSALNWIVQPRWVQTALNARYPPSAVRTRMPGWAPKGKVLKLPGASSSFFAASTRRVAASATLGRTTYRPSPQYFPGFGRPGRRLKNGGGAPRGVSLAEETLTDSSPNHPWPPRPVHTSGETWTDLRPARHPERFARCREPRCQSAWRLTPRAVQLLAGQPGCP